MKKKQDAEKIVQEAQKLSDAQCFVPKYTDSEGLTKLTGLTRTHAYFLFSEGKIKSVSIRRPGSTRGKRLWHVASVLEFLDSLLEEGAK